MVMATMKNRSQVYIMDANNLDYIEGEFIRLTTDGGSFPAWSPDGSQIVYMSFSQTQMWFDLYVYDMATDTHTQITDLGKIPDEPTWAPNGSIIYHRVTLGSRGLRQTNLDGSVDLDISTDSLVPRDPTRGFLHSVPEIQEYTDVVDLVREPVGNVFVLDVYEDREQTNPDGSVTNLPDTVLKDADGIFATFFPLSEW